MTDTIQLTTHFSMNISDFMTDTVRSSYLNNLCALLHINDTSRVVIVGVYTGSVIVVASILPNPSAAVAPGADTSMSGTAALVASMISDSSLAGGLASGMGYQVLGVSSTFYVLPSTSSSSNSSSSQTNVGLIVGVVIGGVIFLICCVLLFFYCLRKRAKIL